MLPIGKLDGTKFIFSSRAVYFTGVLVLLGVAAILGILVI
jgi:hypothetical protein